MRFRDWLKINETGTFTPAIAGFVRPCLPMVPRGWWGDQKRRKPYRQPQVQESIAKNHFSLYSGKPGVKKAMAEGDKIITDFIQGWEEWQKKHHTIGASDTASRDAFVNKFHNEIGYVGAY